MAPKEKKKNSFLFFRSNFSPISHFSFPDKEKNAQDDMLRRFCMHKRL